VFNVFDFKMHISGIVKMKRTFSGGTIEIKEEYLL
jgi:hypothetical protein